MTILIVLVLDQWIKVWVKLNMRLYQEFYLAGEWFRVFFTENEGMAFGLTFGGVIGKLVLSLFRLAAIAAVIYLLRHLINIKASKKLVGGVSLILAGAIGNMIDSAFYGLVFSGSHHQMATFFPSQGGYAGFLQGRVVDMLNFPIYEGFAPEWIPWIGGRYIEFFNSVFNIADLSIAIGVLIVLIFHRSLFKPGA